MSIINQQAYEDVRKVLSWRARESSDLGTTLEINRTNFAELGKRTPVSWSRKRQRLLELIARSSKYPGHSPIIEDRLLTTQLGAISREELGFIYANLIADGLLTTIGLPPVPREEPARQFQITARGWEVMEPIGGGGILGTCFVAMSFNPILLPALERGIIPAIEIDCGLRAVRVDREEHNDNITDRILAGIRSAQCVIADFTFQRQGVYFEAGYALGLGRVVIWTCREDEFPSVHFDTRQYNHIVWRDEADLRQRLADRIRATVALPAKLS